MVERNELVKHSFYTKLLVRSSGAQVSENYDLSPCEFESFFFIGLRLKLAEVDHLSHSSLSPYGLRKYQKCLAAIDGKQKEEINYQSLPLEQRRHLPDSVHHLLAIHVVLDETFSFDTLLVAATIRNIFESLLPSANMHPSRIESNSSQSIPTLALPFLLLPILGLSFFTFFSGSIRAH